MTNKEAIETLIRLAGDEIASRKFHMAKYGEPPIAAPKQWRDDEEEFKKAKHLLRGFLKPG